MVSDGDVVTVSYVGRVQESGEIFDLTAEAVAEEEGMDTEELDLGPVDVLVGAGHVIPGLEDALRDMAPGEERTVSVAPGQAFGERRSDAVETVSKGAFDEHDVDPRPGIVVEIDGRRGKIVHVSSGRVRVDFNHPLAGKALEYEVELRDVVDDIEAAADAVLAYYGLDSADVAVDGGAVSVELPGGDNPELRERLAEELGMIDGVDEVTLS